METYGDRLKKARTEKGLSRPQLAKLCGISVSLVDQLPEFFAKTIPCLSSTLPHTATGFPLRDGLSIHSTEA